MPNLNILDAIGFMDEATSPMYDWSRWDVERNMYLQ